MSEPKDLVILQRLTDLLKGITPANGFDFDLSDAVSRGRSRIGGDEDVPAVNILEAARQDDPTAEAGWLNHKRLDPWTLLVQGWAEDDRENPTDPAYRLKAACETRLNRLIATDIKTGQPLFTADYLFGRMATEVRIGPGIVSPAREGISNRAFFYLPLLVSRVIDTGSVYVETP